MRRTEDLTADRVERLGVGRALDALVAEVFSEWRPDPLDPVAPPAYSTRDPLTDSVLAKVREACGDDLSVDLDESRGYWHCLIVKRADGEVIWQTKDTRRNVAILRIALHFAHRFPGRMIEAGL